MIKRAIILAAMICALVVPVSASPKVTHDDFTGETITTYMLGNAAKNGDYGNLADVNIQKVESQDGTVNYRVEVKDFIPHYCGELIPDAGKVKVRNPATGTEVFMDMPVISFNNNGNGLYTFILSLPAQVVDYQRGNLKAFDAGDYRRDATFRFNAHNRNGQNVTYECSDSYEYPMNEGM